MNNQSPLNNQLYFPHKGDEGKRKGKGKGKGKGKRKGLVAAGLDVRPYMGL